MDQNGARPDAGGGSASNDDLRSRMKLRLSQTKAAQADRDPQAANGSSAPRPAPVGTSVGLSAGLRDRSGSGEVSQMVWNSVLESLSSPAPSLTPSALPSPLAAPTVAAAPAPPPPVQLVAEPQPAEARSAEPPASDSLAALVAEPAAPAVAPAVAPAAATLPAAAPVADPDVDEQQAIAELFHAPAATPDFGPIVPAMPVLAPPSRATAPPRQSTPPGFGSDEASTAAPAPSGKDAKRAKKGKGAPVVSPMATSSLHQRKQRHPIRSFLTFVLVVGLLGGAGFAGWYKFLRHHVVWADDVRPTATFVEQTIHRSFDKTVSVKLLSIPEYEVKLGLAVLDQVAGTGAADPGGDATASAAAASTSPAAGLLALRAVGLIGADPQPSEIGHLVASSVTSFYSPTEHTIYRLAGDSAVYQVDLIRSMTTALLDQDTDFGTAMPTLTEAQRSGYRAEIDGVVAGVVDAKFRAEPSLQNSYQFEVQTRRTDLGITDGGLPVYLSSVITSADHGVPGYLDAPADNPVRGLAAPTSDAPVFDPTRDPAAAPSSVAATSQGQTTQVLGVQFWFGTLVPALGVDEARHAALLWAGESSTTSLVNGQACLASTIATATPADADALASLLGGWAQSRPPSSAATVTPGTDPAAPMVAVSVCEPTEGVTVPTAPLADLATFYTRADTERAVLQRVSELGLTPTAATTSCVVAAFRNGSITGFAADSTDPALIAALTNVVNFCRGG